MHRLNLNGIFCALALGLTELGGFASAADAPPVSKIIADVVARDEATQKQLASMQYHQATHTEQLDASGHVTHRAEAQMIVRPGGSPEIQVVSVKGDQIPSDPDEADRKAKGQEIERRKHNFALKTLATRFNVTLVGQEDCRGLPAYVLAFEPKPNQPYHDQTEKVLNQLHGRMWVSQRDDVVLKTQATLAQPVQVAWVFAKIAKLDFSYELRTATNDFGPAWIDVAVEVTAPFVDIRQHQTVDMTGFEQRSRVAAGK